MNLTEFVLKLELAGIKYEISNWGDATYVELEGGQLGFRFDRRGDLSGGWIKPPLGEREPDWKKWGEYLQ